MPVASDTTVSTGDIARLGRVGRAAVSNWRRRHDDFPQPVAGTVSNPRFALSEVEAWLRRNGKSYQLSAADRVWQHLVSGGEELRLPHRLATAGAILLARVDPALVQLLPTTGRADASGDDTDLAQLLAELADAEGPAAAFEDLCGRLRPRPAEPSKALATAMARIALPSGGTVLDPACGTGTLLLAAGPSGAQGQEVDPVSARIAAARLLLAGASAAPVVAGDALRADEFGAREFDAVVSAPAITDRSWPHDELAADPRFAHGLPPRTEPELAWVQHCLAHVRPGGRVLLRLPVAVAGRRAGRRIRANLLRAGALRAVVAVEDDAESRPFDVWVLRRPASGDPAPSAVLVARTAPDALADVWAAFEGARPLPRTARVVRILDLLDEAVDVSPEGHLPRRASVDAERVVAELLERPPPGMPVLHLTDHPPARSDATIEELARSGVLTVRHAARDVPPNGDLPVLTAADLRTGTTPTGRAGPGPRLVRVRRGDVVAAPMGRVRVADRAAVLGPGLTAYRSDADRLDPEYLAGILRTSAPPGTASTRYGHRVRVPLLPIAEQRVHGEAFRALLAAADAARAAAERADALLRLGGEGLAEGWLRPG